MEPDGSAPRPWGDPVPPSPKHSRARSPSRSGRSTPTRRPRVRGASRPRRVRRAAGTRRSSCTAGGDIENLGGGSNPRDGRDPGLVVTLRRRTGRRRRSSSGRSSDNRPVDLQRWGPQCRAGPRAFFASIAVLPLQLPGRHRAGRDPGPRPATGGVGKGLRPVPVSVPSRHRIRRSAAGTPPSAPSRRATPPLLGLPDR